MVKMGGSARESQQRPPPKHNHPRTVFGGIPVDEIISCLRPWLEPYLHKTVGEAVNRALPLSYSSSLRPPFNLSGNSGVCNLELRFVGEVPRTLYHGNPIETGHGTPLQVTLVARATQEKVVSGPLSLLKVEIVVVNGEFGDDEQEDWTVEHFNESVVREREGKRPLLTGEMNTTLTGGVGTFGTVIFTDNSSWTRGKKFRLGARVVWRSPTETRVKEAVSNPFGVKEHRGEKCKKHYPPFLQDEVWRLVKIRKDGPLHNRLRSHGIETVMDFLQLYEADPCTLKEILGPRTHLRSWNTIVSHAKTCVVDDSKSFTFVCSEDVVLKLNSVYGVVAAAFGDLNYIPLDSWTPHQKATVERLKMEAHRKRSEWLPVDVTANFAQNFQQNEPLINFPVAHQGHQGAVPEPILLPASDNYEAMGLLWPGVIPPSRVLDLREDSHVLRGGLGYNTLTTELEYISRGEDEHCQWLPGSSSCSTLAEGQPPHVNTGGMNSNRSSLTSLNTLGSTSTLPKVDYNVEERPPHPQSDRTDV